MDGFTGRGKRRRRVGGKGNQGGGIGSVGVEGRYEILQTGCLLIYTTVGLTFSLCIALIDNKVEPARSRQNIGLDNGLAQSKFKADIGPDPKI